MGCMSGIVRTIMFVFNFACLAVGIILLAVGSVFYVSIDYYNKIIEDVGGLNIVPGVTIALGVIIFVISFLGCCGALKNNSCMLTSYAALLIILLIIQFSFGIYGAVKAGDEDFKHDIDEGILKAFKKYNDKAIKDIFQSVQSEFKCCGVDSPDDYLNILGWTDGVAGGCCGKPNQDKCNVPTYTDGCKQKLYNAINDSIKIVAYVALGICAIELLGAIVAICLVRSK